MSSVWAYVSPYWMLTRFCFFTLNLDIWCTAESCDPKLYMLFQNTHKVTFEFSHFQLFLNKLFNLCSCTTDSQTYVLKQGSLFYIYFYKIKISTLGPS